MRFSPPGYPLLALLALLQGCQQNPADRAAERSCGAESTAIQAIQGPDSISPLLGSQLTVEAVVTHWLVQDGGALYLQDPQADRLMQASSGLFVDLSALTPVPTGKPGRLLRITGTVTELNGRTGLAARQIADCGQRNLPTATIITELPPASGSLENLVGMRVELRLPLTIANLYWIASNGRFSVVSGGRLYAPTEVAEPGAAAQALARSNQARTLAIVAPSGSIDLNSLPRSGDQLNFASGVLGQSQGHYQLYLDHAPQFQTLNARKPAPQRRGNLRISSFNVLNYFNGDGQGGGFPSPRGASNAEELARQQAKILAAMSAIDADIFALAELENDGYDELSAVSELTAALNVLSSRNYAFVAAPQSPLGTGRIAVGLLYDPAVLTVDGPAMTIVEPPFDRLHRPPLIQSFTHLSSARSLTIAALHLKSKRCNDPQGKNADQGDGQGCFNAARTEAALFLAQWLTRNPPSPVQTDAILMLGDFNAHSREDPLTTLTRAGLVSVMADSPAHHSFVYLGQSGSLDHGFASPDLAAIASASVWHINADETSWLDYNLEHKSARVDALLYHPDAYRSSDHDPLIIDLRF